ncbi:hypothetical protein J3F84DRAFT_104236 [Trichoderma pleuroticola]
MASRHVDIDPDGDTLIILPTMKAEGDDKNEASQVTFRTSMKHLTLASLRAKKVLLGNFSEAVPQGSDGLRHYKFDPMFDPDAFEIVLRIIHAQAHKLPKEISLATMTHVAIIADDLLCSSPIAPFVPQWSSDDNFWAASVQFRETLHKIFICLVFGLKEKFSSMTHKAIINSIDQKIVCGIPLCLPILQAIKVQRTSVLKQHLKYLYMVEKELNDDELCWECRAENIGYLKYNLHLHQLPASESSELWAKMTCRELKDKMKKFKFRKFSGCGLSGHGHPSLKKHIAKALKIFSSPDKGLDLAPLLKAATASE